MRMLMFPASLFALSRAAEAVLRQKEVEAADRNESKSIRIYLHIGRNLLMF
jgi:hypothetical protein